GGLWVGVVGAGVVAGVAVLFFWPSAKFGFRVIKNTAQSPGDHYLVGEEWGCSPVQPRRPCEPIDVSAAVALRPIVQKGDRVLADFRSEEHTSELQSLTNLVCRLLLENKKTRRPRTSPTRTAQHR